MGAVDVTIWNQLKKGQGETNQRLDALLAAQLRTNELLEQLIQVQQGQPRQWYPPAPPWQEQAPNRS